MYAHNCWISFEKNNAHPNCLPNLPSLCCTLKNKSEVGLQVYIYCYLMKSVFEKFRKIGNGKDISVVEIDCHEHHMVLFPNISFPSLQNYQFKTNLLQ